MACFLVPTAEAIAVTAAKRVCKSKPEAEAASAGEARISFSRKVRWLTNMLWGGAALLAFEHVWHGEVTPWFPFLTAASSSEDTAAMLHEMSTIGVTMALLVTLVWIGMVLVSDAIEKRSLPQAASAE